MSRFHAASRRTKILTVAFVITTVGSLGMLVWHGVNGATDTDGDGYASIASGGTDCQDTLSSVYADTTACDDTAAPVFLESTGDPDGTNDIADHAWIKDASGVYHLYFQWNGPDTDIAHFTSTDLKTITYQGVALTHDVSKYYGRIWAPHIIKNGDTYYMYFAGVEKYVTSSLYRQRIGLATSTDLSNWTLYPGNNCPGTVGNGCVYECDNSWSTWGDGTAFDEQCRDPMVIRDNTNNRWVMFSVIKCSGCSGSESIDVAYSTDLINWTGAGYIRATQRLSVGQGGTGGQTTGGTAENPFVFEHNGTYYLTFSDWSDAEPPALVQYVKSTTLTGDGSGSANWTYQGNISDPGVNAIEILKVENDTWLMTQSITNSNSGDDALHHRDLRVKRIVWNSDGTFTTSKLSDLSCRLSSASINPGATEICSDGIDNNCSGVVDETTCGSDTLDGVSGVTINGTATSSQTTVTVNSRQSVISGQAEPNSTVTIALFPGPYVVWATANSSGTWTVTLPTTLPKADYDLYARTSLNGEITNASLIGRLSMSSPVYVPIPTLTAPTSGAVVVDTLPVITGFTKSGTAVSVYIDGLKKGTTSLLTHKSGTAGFRFVLPQALSKGSHTLTVEATDANGNFSRRSAGVLFTVGDPTIGPTLHSAVKSGGRIVLSGVGWGDTDVIVYDNGTQIDIFYIGGAGTQRFNRTLPALTSGTHRITARAYDAAGKPSRLSNELIINQ